MGLGTGIMKGIMRALGALPLGFHYACAGFLSWMLKDVLRYRRDVVMTNLARSFPDKDYKELKAISDRFYEHFGNILAETVWFGGCRDPRRLHRKRLVEYSGIEEFEEAYSRSRGAVVLNSHFGNWELLGGCLEYDYRGEGPVGELVEPPALRQAQGPVGPGIDDVVFVHKPLKSRMWEEVMRENRCAPVLRMGYRGYMSTDNILRFALENKDRKMVYNFPTDQYPYRNSMTDEEVVFMHQETKTMVGAASLARKLGYAVFYMRLRPVRRGRYEWSFTRICQDASQMGTHDIMQRYYDLLQADLEENPWCYLWTHKRWKK